MRDEWVPRRRGVTGKTTERAPRSPSEPSSTRNLGLSPAYLGTWVMSALLLLLCSNKCQAKWPDHYPAQYGTDPAPTGASWSFSIEPSGAGSAPSLLLFVLVRRTPPPSHRTGTRGQILEFVAVPPIQGKEKNGEMVLQLGPERGKEKH